MTRDAFPTRAELERAVEYSGVSTVSGPVVDADDLMALLAVAQWALDAKPASDAEIEEVIRPMFRTRSAHPSEVWRAGEQRMLPPFRDEETTT